MKKTINLVGLTALALVGSHLSNSRKNKGSVIKNRLVGLAINLTF